MSLVTLNCIECGKSFEVRPYRVGEAKFCSRACNGSYYARIRDIGKMGNTFQKGNQVRKGLRPTNAFTSEQVRGRNNPKWIEPIHRTCKECGKRFEKKRWQIGKQRRTADFCSNECSSQYKAKNLSGENSPHWVGGANTYRGRNWLKVRLIVVSNQSGNCADCGKHLGNSLPVHHIRPYREFETAEQANQLDNLIGLCQPCHMKRENTKLSP